MQAIDLLRRDSVRDVGIRYRRVGRVKDGRVVKPSMRKAFLPDSLEPIPDSGLTLAVITPLEHGYRVLHTERQAGIDALTEEVIRLAKIHDARYVTYDPSQVTQGQDGRDKNILITAYPIEFFKRR